VSFWLYASTDPQKVLARAATCKCPEQVMQTPFCCAEWTSPSRSEARPDGGLIVGDGDLSRASSPNVLEWPTAIAVNSSREVIVRRSWFGAQTLYVQTGPDWIWAASDLGSIHGSRQIDLGFAASFIATGQLHCERTIWEDIQCVPCGGDGQWLEGRLRLRRTPWEEAVRIDDRLSLADAARTFKQVLHSAVAKRLTDDGSTWADLSGGHDSSAVVAVAGALRASGSSAGLGGTLTYIDSIGDGDESRFVDAVLAVYPSRSIRFINESPWADDGAPPPATSQPSRDYPYYARDRKVAARLRQLGASRLLSGVGPDFYFPFTAVHAADLVRRGSLSEASHLIVEWSMARREKIWKTTWERILVPNLPESIQSRALCRHVVLPDWLRPSFVTRFGFQEHKAALHMAPGSGASKFQRSIANRMAGLGETLASWRSLPGIIIDHPLLDDDLMKFCCTIPPTIRTHVHRPKPVLYAALDGVLPDAVRRRHTKGSTLLPRIRRTFSAEAKRLSALIERSILAELGVIEPRKLSQAVVRAAQGKDQDDGAMLYYVLSLETWLAANKGQYLINQAS